MKNIITLFGLIIINHLTFGQIDPQNDPKTRSFLLNKIQVSKINNKPIDFYLNNPKIDKYSKMYYKCEFAPSDDDITFGFLDSLLTNNKETRPFYFFVFNQILKIADGALAEGIAFKCLNYITKYPCEFIYYSQNDTLVNLDIWIASIRFTQYNDEFINKIDKVEIDLKEINSDCLEKWINLRKKITKAEY